MKKSEACGEDLRRDFSRRSELVEYLKEEFSGLAHAQHVAKIEGGRSHALERLRSCEFADYAKTRNQLDGAVTGLSPFIRHGVLTLAEVRDHAVGEEAPVKFFQELAWRDYFQRVYRQIGDQIWEDQEPHKTGFQSEDYQDSLPEDIRMGQTGTVMDLFIEELIETGGLHNHARMYLASYVIHWRKVKWQIGASWFLEHLLDGDPASNNLSWQWVASTFSHKPYIFNADNLRKFCAGKYPQFEETELEPFERSYAELEHSLFPLKKQTNPKFKRKKTRR